MSHLFHLKNNCAVISVRIRVDAVHRHVCASNVRACFYLHDKMIMQKCCKHLTTLLLPESLATLLLKGLVNPAFDKSGITSTKQPECSAMNTGSLASVLQKKNRLFVKTSTTGMFL